MQNLKSSAELLTKGLGLGAELAFYVLFSIFAGYYLGNEISKVAGNLGMVIGGFVGLIIVTYRAMKISES